MSIPRNTDVKKHLARSVPRFIAQEKDSEQPYIVPSKAEGPAENPAKVDASPKSEVE
jgi:hypothetical protein